MFNQVRSLFFLLVFLFLASSLCAQTVTRAGKYGLEFASHEVTQDLRTSLNLNPDDPFRAEGAFEVKFDLNFKRLVNSYGYILRIIANDSLNFDLVRSTHNKDFQDLTLIVNNRDTRVNFSFANLRLLPGHWTTVTIRLDPGKDEVSVALSGQLKSEHFPLREINAYRLFFGANSFGKFHTTDVPPMVIKDIRVSASGMKPVQWDLRQHGINEVMDNSLLHRAAVKNPTWLIDRQTAWVHRKEFTINRYPSIAFKSSEALLYAAGGNTFCIFDIRNDSLRQLQVEKGNPAYSNVNQLLYIEELNTVVNYDLNAGIFSKFSFEEPGWDNHDTAYNYTYYRHNNKFYNPFDSSLYTFGGYGYFLYKNKFHRYVEKENRWEEVATTGAVPPRYLSALGLTASKRTAFIFGGYGSESGKQELSPRSFYDLFTFDLRTHAIKKAWEFKAHDDEDLVFSNSLVVNERDSCFYVLSYHKSTFRGFIKLRKYALNKPEFTVLADSIPFQFHDEQSFCDLFYAAPSNELIAVTSHKKEKDQYVVNVYSINYPPLHGWEVFQPSDAKLLAGAYLWPILLASLLGATGYLVVKRRKRKQPLPVQDAAIQPADPAPAKKERSQVPAEIMSALPGEEVVVSTIYVFGGFQVFDRKGADISSKFPSILKELFAFLLLHSLTHEKRVSTKVLCEHFWPDKDEVSARNNRNVNITKLRALLEEVGDIKIENNNSYHRLVLGSDVFCDYDIVARILSNPDALNASMIDLLLKCSKRGSLLPLLQLSWLDNFKADISNKIIDVLLAHSQKLDFYQHDKVLLEIADTIFTHDSINQEALVIKCSVLNKKGKYSLARTWYDHFAKEYKVLYAQNYPKTFDQVLI